ncbi:hypothetical protein Sme01_42580 [Sphaerisporangium melleum]|uniref:Protein kinase domain-containing protein n=1 Tax=Sphaerisporangium melleum TaxID=321316 RepID=A0A917VGD7_9ACTN|nr:serine/threonine-protein kinase [Sphaerisporangium melleum]GGK76863.1 hypothetical protein GCM10007964_19540 [Sphaerisporangium melleum]GII71782.1 hypothetical protein Sme01_42580 [Sphaerisporangium melleum]
MPQLGPLGRGDPAQIGPFRLAGRLGEGGQGVVYLGQDESGERVAVKLLHVRFSGDHTARSRFARELKAAARVASFCTARVIAADLDGDVPYIASEYIEGRSLREAVETGGPLAGGALERLAVGTATALTAIHKAGIVHRDFKPDNVLIAPDGPRVVDFGISRILDSTGTITSRAVGTPAYMAPEQISGGEVGPAADVFAWGSTVAFAATGRAPFGGTSIAAVLNRVLNDEADLSAMPERLRGVVRACLSKDPAARPTADRVLLWLLGHADAGDAGVSTAVLSEGAELAGRETPTTPWPPAARPPGSRSGDAPTGRPPGTHPGDVSAGWPAGVRPGDAPAGRPSGTHPGDVSAGWAASAPGRTPSGARPGDASAAVGPGGVPAGWPAEVRSGVGAGVTTPGGGMAAVPVLAHDVPAGTVATHAGSGAAAPRAPRRGRWIAAAAAVLALAGGGALAAWEWGPEFGRATPPVVSHRPSPSASPSPSRPTFSSIVDKAARTGKLTIAVRDLVPGVALHQQDGWHGFEVELAGHIARQLGVPPDGVTYRAVPLGGRAGALASGRADLVVATYTMSAARQDAVTFAGPYYVSHVDVLVRDGDPFEKLADLAGRKMCNPGASVTTGIVQDAVRVQLVPAATYAECMDLLRAAEVDAVPGDDLLLAGFADRENARYRVLGARLTDERYAVGVPKGDVRACETVRAAISQMYADGTVRGLLRKYFSKVDFKPDTTRPALAPCR